MKKLRVFVAIIAIVFGALASAAGAADLQSEDKQVGFGRPETITGTIINDHYGIAGPKPFNPCCPDERGSEDFDCGARSERPPSVRVKPAPEQSRTSSTTRSAAAQFFQFSLRVAALALKPGASMTSCASSGTILVVDDDAQIRRVLKVALASGRYTVIDGCTGEEALGRLRDDRLALAIVDINLPGMDAADFKPAAAGGGSASGWRRCGAPRSRLPSSPVLPRSTVTHRRSTCVTMKLAC